MKLTYQSCDGSRKTRTFKTLAGARKFAQYWVGKNPEIGSCYAISGDGIGKITAQGVELSTLFGDAPKPAPSPRPSADDLSAEDRIHLEVTGHLPEDF